MIKFRVYLLNLLKAQNARRLISLWASFFLERPVHVRVYSLENSSYVLFSQRPIGSFRLACDVFVNTSNEILSIIIRSIELTYT